MLNLRNALGLLLVTPCLFGQVSSECPAASLQEDEASWLLQVPHGASANGSAQLQGPSVHPKPSLVTRLAATASSRGGAWLLQCQQHLYHFWDSGRNASHRLFVSTLQLGVTSASSLHGSDAGVLSMAFAFICFVFGTMIMLLRVRGDEQSDRLPDAKEKKGPLSFLWPQPSKAILEGAMPAMCARFLANSRDTPFLVPLQPLQAAGEWSLDIISNSTQKAVLNARLTRSNRGQQRSRVEVWTHGRYGELLGSVDTLLNIFLPDGSKFGKLVRYEEEYILHEESGRESRWSMGLEDDGMLVFVWLPKGWRSKDADKSRQHIGKRLRAGLEKLGGLAHKPIGLSQKGPVVASVARPDGSNAHTLEVMTLSGVDDVLVLLSTLGVVAFEHAFEVTQPSKWLEQERQGQGAGRMSKTQRIIS
eukprot:gb/GFBE01016088.1/.p1 GENE.gb/GFBE01016088.1/~~gb/GFBE01016088.1/.p1  ORF type:complete len:419 (+),score=82.01 gb/GFBE01016088.1/:1-1257(+)